PISGEDGFGIDVDLEAVFAGVAGAGYAGGRVRDFAICEPVVLDGGEWCGCEFLEGFNRAGALDRDLGVTLTGVDYFGVEGVVRDDVVVVFALVGGVDANEERI